jgi:hypothetical protein
VQKSSLKADLPTLEVYIVPTNTPNAFATGRDPEHAAVAVTEGIMRLLPEDELEAIIAGGRNDNGPNPLVLLLTVMLAPFLLQ